MQILITGGFGFIGKCLVSRLLAEGGHRITVIDKLSPQVHGDAPDLAGFADQPGVTFIKADICTPGILRTAMQGVDVIYHLAAETGTGQSMYEIQQYFQTNVMGTAILLEEMVKSPDCRPKHLILSSSRSVYGEGAYVRADQADQLNAPRHYPAGRDADDMTAGRFDFAVDGVPLVPVATVETDPADPKSLYAASKLTQEQMCQISCATVGVHFVALRFQNVYGPGQSLRNPYTGIMSIFTNILRQGGQIDIYEDGAESRDFVFVEDVVSALRAAVNLPGDAPAIINVGHGTRTTVSELVALLEAKLGTVGRSRISGRFRPGDIRHCYADIGRMQTWLGLGPLTPIEQGLSQMVDWALEQPLEADLSHKADKELGAFFGQKK
ncbi:MAG: NAD-dependent epimerase/dehydratase family protein [Rhodobacteraceae bacterium]|nr:NAD-dependent epimerase/dehydratase family protein [Paracoccaceae bacterium]